MNSYDKNYFIKRGKFFPLLKALVFVLFIKIFLRPKSLLDVGCALGEMLQLASKLGIKSWGVDISRAAISQMTPSLRSRCQVGSILSLPFKEGSFDIVSCLALLEHIREEDTEKALREVLRVAKKYVLLQVCVKDSPFEGKHYLLDSTHVNVRKNRWWVEKFNDLGLKFKTIPQAGVFLLYKD